MGAIGRAIRPDAAHPDVLRRLDTAMRDSIPGLLKSRVVIGATLAVLAVEAVVVAATYYSERAHLRREWKIIRYGDATKLVGEWRKLEAPASAGRPLGVRRTPNSPPTRK